MLHIIPSKGRQAPAIMTNRRHPVRVWVYTEMTRDAPMDSRVNVGFDCEIDLNEKQVYLKLKPGDTVKATPSLMYKHIRDRHITQPSFGRLEQHEHERTIKQYTILMTYTDKESGSEYTKHLLEFKPFFTVGDALALKLGGRVFEALNEIKGKIDRWFWYYIKV
jgi:hypothetical protein